MKTTVFIYVIILCGLFCFGSCTFLKTGKDNPDKMSDVRDHSNDIEKNSCFISANTYINSGTEKWRKGDTIGAMQDFSKCIESFPNEFVGYLIRASAYYDKNEFSLAIEDYNKVILLDTLNVFKAMCYSQLGKIEYKKGNYLSAIEFFELYADYQEKESLQDIIDTYIYKGRSLYEIKEYNKAIDVFDYLIELSPQHGEAYFFRGYVYSLTEEFPMAFNDFFKAYLLVYDCFDVMLYMNSLLDNAKWTTEKQLLDIIESKEKGVGEVLPFVFFESDIYNLTPQSERIIMLIAIHLINNSNLNIEINGHTDNTNTYKYNLELSQKRAETVREFIISYGISASRVKLNFFADTKPLEDNSTPDGRAKNRRVEIKIVN